MSSFGLNSVFPSVSIICFASRTTLTLLTEKDSHEVDINVTPEKSDTSIFLSSISSSQINGFISVFETILFSTIGSLCESLDSKTSPIILENDNSNDHHRETYFP